MRSLPWGHTAAVQTDPGYFALTVAVTLSAIASGSSPAQTRNGRVPLAVPDTLTTILMVRCAPGARLPVEKSSTHVKRKVYS